MMNKKLTVLVDTFRRFPAASLLAVLNAVFVAWAFEAESSEAATPLSCLYASGLAIVFSAAAGLAGERFRFGPRVRALTQGGVGLVFVLLVVSFLGYGQFEAHFNYSYYLTLAAFGAIVTFALSWTQKTENVFPAMSFAGVIGGAAAVAVGCGLSLVLLAVEKLFGVSISSRTYETLWGASFAAIGTQFFLAYATRREPFEFPKVWRVLLVYVSFPIFLVLLGVLWVYLGKCVVTWKLPNGQVNWIVTVSCLIWMTLHFMLGGVETRPIRLFRRFGAAFVLPLLALQVCALAIRIGEYGLTPSRYASVLFVVFVTALSVLLLVLPSRSGRLAYLLFAALALFAAHSHWNVVDTGVRAQEARLRAFVERRKAGEKFTREDENLIMGTWDFVRRYTLTNGTYRAIGRFRSMDKRAFQSEWGFPYLYEWERRQVRESNQKSFYFSTEKACKFDIVGYTTLSEFCLRKDKDGKVFLADGSGRRGTNSIDVTEALLAALKGRDSSVSNLVLDIGNRRKILLRSGWMSVKGFDTDKPKVSGAWGDCLLLEP